MLCNFLPRRSLVCQIYLTICGCIKYNIMSNTSLSIIFSSPSYFHVNLWYYIKMFKKNSFPFGYLHMNLCTCRASGFVDVGLLFSFISANTRKRLCYTWRVIFKLFALFSALHFTSGFLNFLSIYRY